MNGLDLFSGIGGLALALEPWVRPIAYCENDRYAQAVLLSRMSKGDLSVAPIWDDVRTLTGDYIPETIDIVSGGFPCQDISSAGRGEGLEGKRSGLFFELMRIVEEVSPAFVFLENVPAIRTRGLAKVIGTLSDLRYDCRWTRVSAAEVGAPHLRERWFLLAAHPHSVRLWYERERRPKGQTETNQEPPNDHQTRILADTESLRRRQRRSELPIWGRTSTDASSSGSMGNSESERLGEERGLRCDESEERNRSSSQDVGNTNSSGPQRSEYTEAAWRALAEHRHSSRDNWPSWLPEPALPRGDHGLFRRVDRTRGLGNAVVPLQARTAFARLCGIE